MPSTSTRRAEAVWVERGCGEARIVVGSLSTPAPATNPPRCPLRLSSPPVLHRRKLRLAVSCRGLVPLCAARLTIRIGSRHGPLLARTPTTVVGGGEASLTLSARQARRLAAHRPRLWIRAVLGDFPQEVQLNPRDPTRITTVRLRVRH